MAFNNEKYLSISVLFYKTLAYMKDLLLERVTEDTSSLQSQAETVKYYSFCIYQIGKSENKTASILWLLKCWGYL